MVLKALFVALTLAGVGAASAQTRVVYDSRLPTPEPRLTESERGRVKYLAEQALGAGVWDVDPRLCDGRDFTIHGVAPGAFTVKGAKQTAYLYTYCFFRPGWNQGLVIVQGNEIVAHYAFTNLASSMYALKDINRNGLTELALEYGFTGQGYTEGGVQVVELRPNRRQLARFEAYADDCGVAESGGTWSSQVIRVTPGSTPKFTSQRIEGRCGEERTTRQDAIRPVTTKVEPTGWVNAPTK